MKFLIIDDEISTRESIKILGNLGANKGDEVYEAKNGIEGFQMIEELLPDVVFLDMNMPVMDGADLLNLVDEKRHPFKVIIVSGYTDFKYTKAAVMKKYVIDYIQKPIDEKQLREAIEKATGRKVEDNETVNEKIKNKRDGVVFGIFIEGFEEILKKNYNGSVELFQYFLMCQTEYQMGEVVPCERKEEICPYAFFFEGRREASYKVQAALKSLVKKLAQRYKIQAYTIYCIRDGEEMRKVYMKLCECLNYTVLTGTHRVAELGEVQPLRERKLETGWWAAELISCAKNRNREGFNNILEQLFNGKEWTEFGTIYERKIFISSLLYETGKRLGDKGIQYQKMTARRMEALYSGRQMFTEGFSRQWMQDFMEEIWELLGREQMEIPEKLREILIYIQENYYRKISLSDVADRFFFNPSTVSRMFVKNLGINYIEYLNSLRLEKAKEMLETSCSSISEVAERTGFENTSYFSRQFKKKYGVSPQEYRKSK